MKIFSISTGVSEIHLNSIGAAKKAYLWPLYHEGKVHPVSPVSRDSGAPVYFKPSEEVKEEIMEHFKNKDFSYNEKGSLKSDNKVIEPGILFTAFA